MKINKFIKRQDKCQKCMSGDVKTMNECPYKNDCIQ